jgi:hypothetical protein
MRTEKKGRREKNPIKSFLKEYLISFGVPQAGEGGGSTPHYAKG